MADKTGTTGEEKIKIHCIYFTFCQLVYQLNQHIV